MGPYSTGSVGLSLHPDPRMAPSATQIQRYIIFMGQVSLARGKQETNAMNAGYQFKTEIT
jgi:hypothetical protein